jgi:hypothetical protein
MINTRPLGECGMRAAADECARPACGRLSRRPVHPGENAEAGRQEMPTGAVIYCSGDRALAEGSATGQR